MKYLLCAIGLLAVSTPSQAENWRAVNEYDGYPAVITYVDTDSIAWSGNNAEFVLREFIEGEYGDAQSNFVQRRSVNCTTRTYHILSDQSYIGATPDGTPTEDLTDRPTPANTPDMLMLDAICGNGKYLSDKILDPLADAEEFFYSLEW